jgi:hypothetical protein
MSASLSLRDAIHHFGAPVVAPKQQFHNWAAATGPLPRAYRTLGDTHAHKSRQNRSVQLSRRTIAGQACHADQQSLNEAYDAAGCCVASVVPGALSTATHSGLPVAPGAAILIAWAASRARPFTADRSVRATKAKYAEGGKMERAMKALLLLAILFLAMLSNGERFGHVAKAQTVKSDLAAQIRSQGFACDEAQKATRDAKLSKPDYDVWVLTCKNATYRISRYPDLAAKVEKLK